VDGNIEDRRKEAIRGERMVDEAVIRFREWMEGLDVVPTVVAMREKFEAIAEAELHRTLQQVKLPEEAVSALRRMKSSLLNKILHDPTVFLKTGVHGRKEVYIDFARKLFNLDTKEEKP